MERLSGFEFEDADGMKAAGIDTNALLRAGLISFLEGALVHGVFHGDLHGGNLFVLPDGRTALLDFGITGRLDERKRLAFLRLLSSGAPATCAASSPRSATSVRSRPTPTSTRSSPTSGSTSR